MKQKDNFLYPYRPINMDITCNTNSVSPSVSKAKFFIHPTSIYICNWQHKDAYFAISSIFYHIWKIIRHSAWSKFSSHLCVLPWYYTKGDTRVFEKHFGNSHHYFIFKWTPPYIGSSLLKYLPLFLRNNLFSVKIMWGIRCVTLPTL